MRKFITVLIIISMSNAVSAVSATTKGSYYACTSEQYLDDMRSFAISGDTSSTKAYQEVNRCVILEAGLVVVVLANKWSGKVQIEYRGLKMWTARDAITIN